MDYASADWGDNRTLSNKVFTNSTVTLEMVTIPCVNPCENIFDLISDHDTMQGNTVIMHTTLESISIERSRPIQFYINVSFDLHFKLSVYHLQRFYPKRLTISTLVIRSETIYRCWYSKDVHRTKCKY